MSIKRRIEKLESKAMGPEPIQIRVLWDNGDGTATDTETGEVVQLADDAIRVRWPEDL